MSWVLVGVSAAATIAGTVVGVQGAKAESRGKQAMSAYQAQVAHNNAIIAERNAEYAIAAGQLRGDAVSMKTAQTVGQQKAGFAAGNIDVNSGSPLDVRASTAELGKLDTLTVLNEAANKAATFRAQGAQFEAEAGLDVMKGNYAKTAGEYKVASTLISGAGSFSDKWLGWQSKNSNVPNVWGE